MPTMSSEEALNNIFNLLTAMMDKFAETDKKKAEGKSEDNVSRLINGLLDSSDSRAAANAGLQLESLAKGMNEISKIDANQIKAVSASIDNINSVMNKFTVPTKTVEGLQEFIEAIWDLSKIDGNIANNLNQFISDTKDSFTKLADLSQAINDLNIQSGLLDTLYEFSSSFSNLLSIDTSILTDINDKFNNLSQTLSSINMPSDIARLLYVFTKSVNSFEKIDTRSLTLTAKQVENAANVLSKINISQSTIDGINEFMSAVEGIKNIDVSTLKTLADQMGLISSTISSFKVDRNIKGNIQRFIDSLSDLKDINTDSADSIKNLTANLKDALSGLSSVLGEISSIKIPKESVNNISAVIGTFAKLESIDADSFSNISDNLDSLMRSISDLDISDDIIKDVETLSKALEKLSGTNIDIKGIGKIPDLSSALTALESMGSLGDSIDNIVKSIDELDKIDSGSIDKLKTFIQSLKIDNAREIRDSVTIVVSTVKALSEISKIDTKSMNRALKRIKPELADNIVEFIVKLTKNLQKYDSREIQKIIKPVGDLFSGLNAIVSTNVFKMRISLNPLRGYLLGRQIGKFVKAISKYVKDAKIPASIKHLSGILDPIAKFADPNNKFSVWKLRKALNKHTARIIANFFIEICELIKERKADMKLAMYNVEKLMEILLKFSVFMAVHFKLTTMMLSLSSAEKLNKFLHTLVKGKWDTKKVDALGKFITRLIFTFTGALAAIIAVVAIAPMSAVVAGFAVMYYGLKGIKKMILELTDPKTGIKKRQAKNAAEVLKSINGVIFAVSASIGGIAIISALFGMDHVILSLIITRLAITGITKIIAQLALKEIAENTGKSAKTFREISLLLMSVTGSIVILTLLSKFTSPEDMIISTGILALAFGAVTGIIIWLSHKLGQEDIETATKVIKDISHMLLMLTASITILAVVNKYTDSIWSAFGVVALTVSLMAATVIVLSHKIKKKDLDEAVKTIHAFTLMMLGITASITVLALVFNKFDDGVVWQGLAMVTVVVGMMAGIVILLTHKIKKKDLSEARKTLLTLTACLVIVSLVTENLLVPIGKHLGNALKGAVTVIAILGALVTMTKWLTTFSNKKLHNALTALAVLTACLTIVSLVTRFLLVPIGADAKPALFGAGVALGVVLALVGILGVITKIDDKELKHSLITLGVLTAELLIISLIIKTLLIPIGYDAANALQGSLIAAGVVLAMIGLTYLLTLVDDKSMKHSLITMGVLTVILLAVAATIKYLLIPIGESAKEAMYGAGIAIGVVLVMVGMTYLLSLVKQEVLMKNLVTMAALTAMLVVVSLTTKYLLIPIGKEAKAALYGAGVALGIVTVMLGMIWLIGKYLSKASEQMKLGMVEGAGFLAAAAGILWLIGNAVPPFVEISRIVGEDPGKIALGGAIILGAITWITALMVAVGSFCENPMVMLAVGVGAGVVAAATGVLWGIGKIMLTFTEVIEAIKSYNADTLIQSAKGIGILLAAMGESLVGVIALSPVATLGAAAMIPLTAAVFGLFKILTYTANNILELNKKITADDIKKFNGLIYNKEKDDDPNTLIGSINNIMTGLLGLGFWRSVLTTIISVIIRPIIDTVSQFIDIILKVATAHYVTGYDDNGKPIYERIPEGSFGRAATLVNNGFAEFLTKINEGFNALDTDVKLFGALYAKTLKPIVKLVGQFVDIVMKVATGTYIIGYDDNGKPEYQHLTAKEFGDAGYQVSLLFAIFLGAINNGFKNMDSLAIATMKIMKGIMGPVIKQVSQFVDIVMKVATATYVTGYDDNGNPEYEKLSADDFSKAGKAVSTLFSLFLDSLNKSFSQMSVLTILSMRSMKKAVGPIMEMLSRFVDAVMKVATGTYVSGYDKDGNPEITHIEPEEFMEAGVVVADTFGLFINSLNDAFKNLSYSTIEAIKSMKGAISPIMDGVSSFVDAIIKYASGLYIYAYDKDKDGNYTVPLFAKITGAEMEDAAISIANNFALFVEKITESFDKGGSIWGNKTEDALEAIAESIGPIMEGLGSYVDAIVLVATGSYIDHMEKDKDGKLQPVYKHLEVKQFEDAAITVARMFVSFVNTLINKFSDEQFKEKAKNLQDIISESISPIMDAVKDFSEALKPFLNMKKQTTDAKGKKSEQYVCFQKGMIVQIANDIANGFVSFIKIISEGLTSDQMKNYYKEVKKVSKSVSETLDNIKKSAVNLGKTINALNGENGVVEKGESSARAFIAVLDIFANYYRGNVSFEDSVEPAKNCSKLMKIVGEIAKRYKNIIQAASNIDDKKLSQTEVINRMNKNMLSMANNLVAVNDAVSNINFSNIYELLNAYTNMSMKYMELSMMMSRNPEMEDGFMKFIKGMHKLTDAGLQDNISKTGFAITKYTTHLNRFTILVRSTTQEVKVYVTAMESARKVLAKFDEQIITKAKQREQALQNLADKINNIADAIDNMRGAFAALDEESVIERFDGIKKLLELAGIYDKNEGLKKDNTKIAQSNTQKTSSRPTPQRQNGNTYNTYGGRTSGHVTFQFANTVLDGTFKMA